MALITRLLQPVRQVASKKGLVAGVTKCRSASDVSMVKNGCTAG